MSIGIQKLNTSDTGCEVIVGVLKIITDTTGTSILAPLDDTIKVIHSLGCNTASSPAMPAINSINPAGVANKSVAYFDAGVE